MILRPRPRFIIDPYRYGGGGAALPGTTWNTADKGAGIVLSNGDLSVSNSLSSTWRSVRSIGSHSSGIRYFEVVHANDDADLGYYLCGVMKSGAAVSSFIGNDANGWGFAFSRTAQIKLHNGSFPGYGDTTGANPGDVIGILLDLGAGTLTFYENGVSQGTAYSSLSGTFFAAASVFTTGLTMTARFGSASWTHAPGVGEVPWS